MGQAEQKGPIELNYHEAERSGLRNLDLDLIVSCFT
jgi:hypothetical protein